MAATKIFRKSCQVYKDVFSKYSKIYSARTLVTKPASNNDTFVLPKKGNCSSVFHKSSRMHSRLTVTPPQSVKCAHPNSSVITLTGNHRHRPLGNMLNTSPVTAFGVCKNFQRCIGTSGKQVPSEHKTSKEDSNSGWVNLFTQLVTVTLKS